MTQVRVVVPYRRPAARMTRRDIAISAGDSVSLRVTVVETDDPRSAALDISGGLGGPALGVAVWHDDGGRWWDYGLDDGPYLRALWSGSGTRSDAAGAFDVRIPASATADWPRRCSWAARLTWPGDQASTLASGYLHVLGARHPFAGVPPLDHPIIISTGAPLLTRTGTRILAGDGTAIVIP